MIATLNIFIPIVQSKIKPIIAKDIVPKHKEKTTFSIILKFLIFEPEIKINIAQPDRKLANINQDIQIKLASTNSITNFHHYSDFYPEKLNYNLYNIH